MADKTFHANIRRKGGETVAVAVVGFQCGGDTEPFTSLRIGEKHSGQMTWLMTPEQMRAIAAAMNAAADFAEPRAATAADLGLEAA